MARNSRWTNNPFRSPNTSPEQMARIKARHAEIDRMVEEMRAKEERNRKDSDD